MRPSTDDVLATLRLRGHRLTAPRRMIVEQVIDARDHIAADAVHRAVAARYPTVNRSTVYRTLDLLERHGFLSHHHDATGIVYHHADEHGHVHLACLACDHVEAVDAEVGARFVSELDARHGFKANLPHSTIFGVCGGCAAEGQRPEKPHRH